MRRKASQMIEIRSQSSLEFQTEEAGKNFASDRFGGRIVDIVIVYEPADGFTQKVRRDFNGITSARTILADEFQYLCGVISVDRFFVEVFVIPWIHIRFINGHGNSLKSTSSRQQAQCSQR